MRRTAIMKGRPKTRRSCSGIENGAQNRMKGGLLLRVIKLFDLAEQPFRDGGERLGRLVVWRMKGR